MLFSFFVILVIVNVIFIITLLVFMGIEMFVEKTFVDDQGNSYIQLAHDIFSLTLSTILFFIGLNIKKMITVSLKDSFKNDDMNYYIDDDIDEVNNHSNLDLPGTGETNNQNNNHNQNNQTPSTNVHKDREIYFSKRMTQINIVTITFLACDSYELIYLFCRMVLIRDDFQVQHFISSPMTNFAVALQFMNNLAILTPVLTNYFAFYFLIKDSYEALSSRGRNKRLTKENTLNIDEIISRYSSDQKSNNKDIENYLV
jgi:hypothetical protein